MGHRRPITVAEMEVLKMEIPHTILVSIQKSSNGRKLSAEKAISKSHHCAFLQFSARKFWGLSPTGGDQPWHRRNTRGACHREISCTNGKALAIPSGMKSLTGLRLSLFVRNSLPVPERNTSVLVEKGRNQQI